MKAMLEQIIAMDGAVPDQIVPLDFSLQLLELMGEKDPQIRDDLALTVLYSWIVSGELSESEIRTVLARALDQDHLFRGIGDWGDHVYMRTFSALVVAAALRRHREKPFLTRNELMHILEKSLFFYRFDVDVRGYTEEGGWAHGAAHGADILTHFCQMDNLGADAYRDILDSVYYKATIDYYGYTHEEYERMNNAVAAVIVGKRLSEQEILEWLEGFRCIRLKTRNPEKLIQRSNINHFLRSLYFRIHDAPVSDRIQGALLELINAWNAYR